MDDKGAPMMSSTLRKTFETALQEFTSSQSLFRILWTVPISKRDGHGPIKTVYVLDSSFNPPSKAHALLAKNALAHDHGSRPASIMLLLATENADKKFGPAPLEDRIAMMKLMAESLHHATSVPVNVAVTKKPFFVDKAKSIDDSGVLGDAQQVHLTGYDTFIRIFDSKYYPADEKLGVLNPLLAKHRLRVTYRLGDKFGTREEQDKYMESIGDGSREDEGMKKEWKDKIEMVDDAADGTGVSSTEARKAKGDGRQADLSRYVDDDVAEYIVDMDLYTEGQGK